MQRQVIIALKHFYHVIKSSKVFIGTTSIELNAQTTTLQNINLERNPGHCVFVCFTIVPVFCIPHMASIERLLYLYKVHIDAVIYLCGTYPLTIGYVDGLSVDLKAL